MRGAGQGLCGGRTLRPRAPGAGRVRLPGGGDEVRPAEDLALSSFGLGARVACWCGATRPLAAMRSPIGLNHNPSNHH